LSFPFVPIQTSAEVEPPLDEFLLDLADPAGEVGVGQSQQDPKVAGDEARRLPLAVDRDLGGGRLSHLAISSSVNRSNKPKPVVAAAGEVEKPPEMSRQDWSASF
jgi:hypothetical protein